MAYDFTTGFLKVVERQFSPFWFNSNTRLLPGVIVAVFIEFTVPVQVLCKNLAPH